MRVLIYWKAFYKSIWSTGISRFLHHDHWPHKMSTSMSLSPSLGDKVFRVEGRKIGSNGKLILLHKCMREREMERGNFTCTFIVGQPKEIISISISGNLKDQDYYIFVRYWLLLRTSPLEFTGFGDWCSFSNKGKIYGLKKWRRICFGKLDLPWKHILT